MNKKALFLSLILSLGGISLISAQEVSDVSVAIPEIQLNNQDQTYNAYKTTWQKNRFKDNWTIAIGGGVQTIFGEDDSKADFSKRLSFAPQFSLTKYFSPIWGLRFNLTGGTVHGYNDGNSGTYRKWNRNKNYEGKGYAGHLGYPSTPNADFKTWDPQWNYMYSPEEVMNNVQLTQYGWEWKPAGRAVTPDPQGGWRDANGNLLLYQQSIRYIQANIDFMFNFFNLIGNYNPRRFYELTPYGGIGVYNAFGHQGRIPFTTFGVHGGFLSKFRISDKFEAQLDLSGSLTPDEFDGQSGGDHNFTVLGQATVGIGYKFGKTDWTPIEPMDYDLINKLNDKINELLSRPLPVCPECPKCPPVEKPKVQDSIVFLPDPVFFKINKSVIDPAQWASVEKAVDFLIKHPDANVVITGYADKDTGTPAYNMKLSERRAKTVADALIQRYGINPLRISINWSGENIQPFKINEWNRVVIFVIEED